MGLKYSDLYINSKKADLARSNLYREDTNVFSYYIVTSLLLVNYGEFFEWCSVHNGNGGIIAFNNTDANVLSFAHFIVMLSESTITKNNIKGIGSKKCFNVILKSNKLPEYRKWVSETMRMSVCEMS